MAEDQRGHLPRRALLIGAGSLAMLAAAGTAVRTVVGSREADGGQSPQPPETSARHSSPRPAASARLSPVARMRSARPFTVAHRGGSADWPEGSQYAYQQAVRMGVDALEMSVGRTSDGVWFGCHDRTLDRSSGTSGFVIAEHTWKEVQQHTISPPAGHPDQPNRPYWRLDEFIESYKSSHALWIDPKAAEPELYPELLALMARHVRQPKEVFVAKSMAQNTAWAQLSGAHRIQSWGFYFSSDLHEDPQLLARTQKPWTMFGLDWDAPAQQWRDLSATGRPLVAHVLSQRAQRQVALDHGAQGLMIAGVTEVLG